MMEFRLSDPPQEAVVADFLRQRSSLVVARRGELVSALDHPAVIAVDGSDVLGVLTYVISGLDCEVLTLHAAESWRGVGTALLSELDRLLSARGCTRMWLITTNDNVDALRFYQRRGFHLVEVRPGAVDVARRELKPSISQTGDYGIALRDELVLEKSLTPQSTR